MKKKSLLLIDNDTSKRSLTNEEQSVLPSSQYSLVITTERELYKRKTNVDVIVWRLTLGYNYQEALLVANKICHPNGYVVLVAKPGRDELIKLGKSAKKMGIELLQRVTASGVSLLHFQAIQFNENKNQHDLNSNPSKLTNIQLDFLNLVFDETWYRGSHPVAVNLVKYGSYKTVLDYFVKEGSTTFDSPGPLFDARLLHLQGIKPTLIHYLTVSTEIAPCPLFNEKEYLKRYPDIVSAINAGTFISGYHHFLKSGYIEDRRPHPFVLPYSVRQELGLAFGDSPLEDFQSMIECQSKPGPIFDEDWYKAVHKADLIKHNLTPLQHFSLRDISSKASPLPDFDVTYYLQHNSDLKEHKDPVLHYLFNGIQEERRPNDFFDPDYYLSQDTSILKEISKYSLLGGLEHFLLIGRNKGYQAHRPLSQTEVDEREGKAIFERNAERVAADVRMGRRITFPEVKSVNVSIVIPVVNNFAFTVQLLKQLSYHIALDTEVIVVDAASVDETKKLENYVKGISVLHLEKRSSFSSNCNLGAKHAKGDVIIFMNNDVLLDEDTITATLNRINSRDNIACVGGRIIRSHGLVQEAGNVIWSDGSTAGIGRGAYANDHNFFNVRDVDMCSACFLAVKRQVFEEIGGYDEVFDPGYGEDADLSIRFQQAGYSVVYEPAAVVIHYEYGSYSKSRPPSASVALILKHRQIVHQKHANYLKKQPSAGSQSPLFAADHKYRKRDNILFIEDRPPEKYLGSGYVRSVDIIQYLVKSGFNIVVWAREQGYEQNNYYPDLQGIDVFCTQQYNGGLSQFLMENGEIFKVLWVCRTHNMAAYYQEIKYWKSNKPEGLIFADTEALSAVREVEQLKVFGSNPRSAEEKLKKEIDSLAIADLVITVSKYEMQLVNAQLDGKDCYLLSHMGDQPRRVVSNLIPREEFESREYFGFLGSVHSMESPNLDSILWLSNECFPIIKKQLPKAKLIIAGYWDKRVSVELVKKSDGIEFIGTVDDLDEFFSKIRVFLVPTRFAAGLPQKIATAFAQQVPCVVSPLLDKQLGLNQEEGYLSPDELLPDCYADLATKLYNDYELWNKLRKSGIEAVQRDYSQETFENNVKTVIKNI